MLTLNDGRAELWQWDTGRTLAVDADCSQVHFSNKVFGRSIDVDVIDGTAIIPDVLLQTDKDLNVWAFVGTAENGYTKISKTFNVNRRNKPADYVFTPTEQMTLQMIQRQIGDLADLTTDAKETLVAAINEAARTGGGGGGSTVELDTTLTQSGKAADAAVVGNRLSSLSEEIAAIPSGKDGADGKSAYQYAVDGGYTGTETEFSTKLAQEKFANPNALTFTGAVTGSYDGSAPLSVEIPSGGGGSGGGDDVFELIGEATSSGVSDDSGLTIPFDGSLYKTIIAYAYNLPAGNKKRIIIRTKKAWYDGYPMGWNTVIDTHLSSMTDIKNTWGFFGVAIDVGGKLFTLGAAEANTNGGHGYFRFWPQSGALPTLSLSDCKFISLDCNSNSEKLPDGCSLIVWGVRK